MRNRQWQGELVPLPVHYPEHTYGNRHDYDAFYVFNKVLFMNILCFFFSSVICVIFFVSIVWVNKDTHRQHNLSRLISNLVTYILCAFIIILPYCISDSVEEYIVDLAFLFSIVLCNGIATGTRNFLGVSCVDKNYKHYIHGLILSLALIFLANRCWQTSITLLAYFLGFYIDFEPMRLQSMQARVQNFITRELKPILLNCLVITLIFIASSYAEVFFFEYRTALQLPWVIAAIAVTSLLVIQKYRSLKHQIS